MLRKFRRSSRILLLGIVIPALVGCCECGRPRFWHDGFPTARSAPSDTTPEGYPRQRIGYPQFAGEHDRRNRIAGYGHPNYHNEYPTPDYAVVPYSNRPERGTW